MNDLSLERCLMPDSPTAEALTVLRRVPLADLQHPVVRGGLQYWTALKSRVPMPTKAHVRPRELGKLLSSTTLIKVIPGSDDFEFRVVGDAIAMGLLLPLQGRRLSELPAGMRDGADFVRQQCRLVSQTGEPHGWRLKSGDELCGPRFVCAECLRLPLHGPAGKVDYILSFVGLSDAVDFR